MRRHPAVLGLREYPLGKTWGFPVGAGEGRCGEQGTRSGGPPPTRGRLEIWWEGFFFGLSEACPPFMTLSRDPVMANSLQPWDRPPKPRTAPPGSSVSKTLRLSLRCKARSRPPPGLSPPHWLTP